MSERKSRKTTSPRCRLCVRPRVIIFSLVAGVAFSFGLDAILPDQRHRPSSVDGGTSLLMPVRSTDEHAIRQGPVGPFDASGPINVDQDGAAVHGYDVVAYFTLGRPVEGVEEHEVEYRNATFRFASSEHKEIFLSDPEAYVPAYGGYCAVGIAHGYKDGMHPEAFEIVDGRLFFNLAPWIHESWRQNMNTLIVQADERWPTVKDSLRIGPGSGPSVGPE